MLLTIIHRISQEPGAMPGKGLSILSAIAYFVLAPLVLFILIGAISALASADRKKSSSVSRID